jgi:beta-phosphoglucomutase-like phosphatase (HAD superfamily)
MEGVDIRAVLFDLDGTLLDTESLSTDAIQAVVGRFGKTFTWWVRLGGVQAEVFGS